MEVSTEFERFVSSTRRALDAAFVMRYGIDRAQDASAAALAYAWEHWARVGAMANPVGYLYRVGQSAVREPRRPVMPAPADVGVPDVEPALVPALLTLPLKQRTAVWLVYACQWTYAETAEAMGIGEATVGTHLRRGLESLRGTMEGDRVRS